MRLPLLIPFSRAERLRRDYAAAWPQIRILYVPIRGLKAYLLLNPYVYGSFLDLETGEIRKTRIPPWLIKDVVRVRGHLMRFRR